MQLKYPIENKEPNQIVVIVSQSTKIVLTNHQKVLKTLFHKIFSPLQLNYALQKRRTTNAHTYCNNLIFHFLGQKKYE